MGALDDDHGNAFPPLQQNYARGTGLLYLATEQVRLFDPITADIITNEYLTPLRSWFENALRSPDYENAIKQDPELYSRWCALQAHDHRSWKQEIVPTMPPTPPGLGYGGHFGLNEAKPRGTMKDFGDFQMDDLSTLQSGLAGVELSRSTWPRHTNSSGTCSTTYDSGTIPARKDFGAIGSRKKPTSESSIVDASGWWRASTLPVVQDKQDRTARRDASAFEDYLTQETPEFLPPRMKPVVESDTSRPNPRADSVGSEQITGSPEPLALKTPEEFYKAVKKYVLDNKEELLDAFTPAQRVVLQRQGEPGKSWGLDTGSQSKYASDTSENSLTRVQSGISDTAHAASLIGTKAAAPQVPTASSWARIAALTESDQQRLMNKVAPSGRPPLRGTGTAKALPLEPEAQQYRVVFIANLPRAFTAHDVSIGIQTGAVMSILMQTDAHESLPGLSACVIFMEASAAAAFLAENHYSTTTEECSGPSVYAGLSRTTRGRILDKTELKAIRLFRGGPYALEGILASMGPPNYHRRRVKWSRARLFYDVSIRQFKKDVLSAVNGAHNVEIFHFYNPGECTVVFASVDVAATCVAQFELWKNESLEAGNVRSEKFERGFYDQAGERRDRAYSGAGHAWGDKGGDGALKPVGHLDGVKGRYSGVEFGFVKDFNEVPAKLYSQYGKDGRLRSSSRMEGCEGLYEG